MAARRGPLYLFLYNKWYFDELYDFLFVRPAKWLGHFLWKVGDGKIIDGLGPDGVSAGIVDWTRQVVRLQTGYVYHYAFAMLIGVAILATWFIAGGRAVTRPSLRSSRSFRCVGVAHHSAVRARRQAGRPARAADVALSRRS